jgi:hypothetical protein
MKYYGVQNEVKAYINRLQSEQGITVSSSVLKTLNDRVEALKKSGDWSRYSLGFNDVDGDAYLSRAGVTDPLGRCEVLWFTRGIKALNLWKSLICWPMRSYQNIGSGATVYSLGGLGIFNGTAVNSPTWGSSGVNFSSNTQLITFASNIPAFTYTLLTIVAPATTITAASTLMAPIGVRTFGGLLLGSSTGGLTNELITRYVADGDTTPSATKAGGYTGAGSILANTFNYINASITDNGLLLINWNGSSLSVTANTEWVPNNSVSYTLGDRLNNDGSFFGNMSFSGLINQAGDTAQQVLFYNLYKNTLGNGLGLP